ncbi:uncharacterized protein LAESUDRAFT_713670 [Laetiporus sulphureus 93-53]|uniref:Uncharacterized protein n=1 Tax=Laetiporus sulphureus 93-53 TaxID=1314785 RepID=A0A165EJ79_9APHY|nr:uncharacterized protein LAESUDRAFT_713670 [Laetiporus sulphureus 93-53]KZT07163.1 hypothetical protein LAESUDRAFT_713670 [Laetiporus sulphureus 93-53]
MSEQRAAFLRSNIQPWPYCAHVTDGTKDKQHDKKVHRHIDQVEDVFLRPILANHSLEALYGILGQDADFSNLLALAPSCAELPAICMSDIAGLFNHYAACSVILSVAQVQSEGFRNWTVVDHRRRKMAIEGRLRHTSCQEAEISPLITWKDDKAASAPHLHLDEGDWLTARTPVDLSYAQIDHDQSHFIDLAELEQPSTSMTNNYEYEQLLIHDTPNFMKAFREQLEILSSMVSTENTESFVVIRRCGQFHALTIFMQ